MDQQAFQIDFVQGVWVFAIFVCKRNVYKVMSGQARSLHSSIRSLSTQMSGEDSLPFRATFSVPGQTNRTPASSTRGQLKKSASSEATREISINTGSVPEEEAHQMEEINSKP